MSITIVDDFFSQSDFAQSATYTPSGGSPSTITVIYDNEYISSIMDGVEVENTNPIVMCRTSDVVNAKHGDTITVNSIAYKIINIKPDGTGITTIELSTM